MTALPKIVVREGRVYAGDFELEPANKNWAKKRTFWRARLDGKPVTPFLLTPKLAVAAALRRAS